MDSQKYLSIFEKAPFGYATFEIIYDSNSNPIDFLFAETNDVFFELVQIERKDIKGKSLQDVIKSDFNWIEVLKNVVIGGKSVEIEQFSNIANAWYKANLYMTNSHTLVSIINTLSGKNYNFENHKNELPFKEFLYENAKDGLVVFNQNHKIIDVNQQFCKMLGYTAEELRTKYTWDFESILNEEEIRQNFDPNANIDSTFESLHRRKDGTTYSVEVSAKSYDWDGNKLVYCSCRDITERKEAEAEQKRITNLLNKLAEQVPGVIYQYQLFPDGSSKFPYSSQGMWGIYEVTPEQVREDATPVFGRLHPDDLERISFTINKSAETLENYYEEFRVILPEQGLKWRYCNAKPEKMEDGSVLWHGIITDITDRKEAEISLKHSFELLNYVISNNNGGIAVHDKNMNYIYVSRQYISDYHLDGIDLIGKNHYEIIPNIPKKWRDVHSRVLKGEIISAKNDPYLNEKGEKMWTDWECRPWYGSNGKIEGIIVYTEDVTKRVNSEQAIFENEARFRQITEVSQTVIWEVNAQGLYTYVSPIAEKVWGYKPEELIGKLHYYDIHPKSEKENFKQKTIHLLKKKELLYDLLNAIEKPDGQLIWVKTNGLPIVDANGNLTGYRGSDVDVTDNIISEKKLKESEIFASTISNTSPALMYIYDFNLSRNIWTNTMYQELFNSIGKDINHLEYLQIKELVHPTDFLLLTEKIQQLLNDTKLKKTSQEIRIMIADKWKWMNLLLSVFKTDESGKPYQLLGAMFDIDDKKKSEYELIRAKDKAEESDRLKTAFLQNMSHEIRTPMNGIIGFINLLAETDISEEEKKQYIDVVNKSAQRLLNTINDIVEISKIEAGVMEIKISEVKIDDLMNFQLNFFRVISNEKGLNLNYYPAKELKNRIIETDKHRFDGIMTNLLYNAIKFTKKGSIEFGNYIQNNEFVTYVKDTGIGIPKDKVEKIFERFIQADINTTRPYEGSGLGLTISKAYIEALGGRIWVETEIDKGSTFYFALPLNETKEIMEDNLMNQQKLKDNSETKRLMLIAEDEDLNYLLMTKMLKNEGFEFLHAENGEECVSLLRQNPEVEMILMDIKMPVLNGLDATAEIRKFNQEIPIIAQTAHALSGEREKVLMAGCTDYITKPISRNDLIDKIRKYKIRK
jgi:PAS domain S-box-containing protein